MDSKNSVCDLDPSLQLPCLSESSKSSLIAPFIAEDIFKVIKSMSISKSPGPDGVSSEFYVTAWHIVGGDVVNAIMHFFSLMHMPRMVNSTVVTEIPKIACPTSMADFHPISCCNTIYKCISKLLAVRRK